MFLYEYRHPGDFVGYPLGYPVMSFSIEYSYSFALVRSVTRRDPGLTFLSAARNIGGSNGSRGS